MVESTLYELLGMPKERADEIARMVREAFSESRDPVDWIRRLLDEMEIGPEKGDAFACGWYAGRYAGVSEVFKVVQREMEELERDKVERDRRYTTDGYA